MRRTRTIGLGCLLLTAALGVMMAVTDRGSAATLIALDLPELVRSSEHVVIARAGTRTSRKAADTGLYVTDVKLKIVASFKGGSKPGATLVATLLGGTIGEIGLHVPGEAVLPSDRSAIVFLRRAKAGELNVTGMSQGVMPISGEGAAATVIPGGAGAELVQAGEDGKLREAPDALMRPRALSDVLGEIRRLAAVK